MQHFFSQMINLLKITTICIILESCKLFPSKIESKVVNISGDIYTKLNLFHIPLRSKVIIINGEDSIVQESYNGKFNINFETIYDCFEIRIEPYEISNSQYVFENAHQYHLVAVCTDLIYEDYFYIHKNRQIKCNINFENCKVEKTKSGN